MPKVIPGAQFMQKQVVEMDERTQFVGENEAFGKEVNRRLNDVHHLSIYEQIGILRKAIKSIGCADEEFVAFDALVEEIKAEIRAEEQERP